MEKILLIIVLLIWLLVPALTVTVALTAFKRIRSRKNLFDNQEFTERFILFVSFLMLLIGVLFIFFLLSFVLFNM
jgi:hypothetical protein